MKRHLSLIAIALVLSTGAFAQTIVKSLQGSQDPRGPVGLDASGNAYFPDHILGYGNQGVTPTATPCGVTSAVVSGTDVQGKLTTGSTATTCTFTFGTAFGVAPACLLQTQGGATQPTFTTTTTGINVTVDAASTVYNYVCLSPQ